MNEARIKLAEAMGWERVAIRQAGSSDEKKFITGKGPEQPRKGQFGMRQIPNSFTDANDDYAVLEWVRETYDVPVEIAGSAIKRLKYVRFREAVYQMNNGYADGYRMGNYARAACKVLGIEVLA